MADALPQPGTLGGMINTAGQLPPPTPPAAPPPAPDPAASILGSAAAAPPSTTAQTHADVAKAVGDFAPATAAKNLANQAALAGYSQHLGDTLVQSVPTHAQQVPNYPTVDQASVAASSQEMARLDGLVKQGLLVGNASPYADAYQRLVTDPTSVAVDERQAMTKFQVDLATKDAANPNAKLPVPLHWAGVDYGPGGVTMHVTYDQGNLDKATPPLAKIVGSPQAPVTSLDPPIPPADGPLVTFRPEGTVSVFAPPSTDTRDSLRTLRPLTADPGDQAVRYVPVVGRRVDEASTYRAQFDGHTPGEPPPHSSQAIHPNDAAPHPATVPGNFLLVEAPGTDPTPLTGLTGLLRQAGVPMENARQLRPFLRFTPPTEGGVPHVGLVVPLGDSPSPEMVKAAWNEVDLTSSASLPLRRSLYLQGSSSAPSSTAKLYDHVHVDNLGQTLVHRSATAEVDAPNAVPVFVPTSEAAQYQPTDNPSLTDQRPASSPSTVTRQGSDLIVNGELRVLTGNLPADLSYVRPSPMASQVDGVRPKFAAISIPGDGLPTLAFGMKAPEDATAGLPTADPRTTAVVRISGPTNRPDVSVSATDPGIAVEAVRLLRRAGVAIPQVRKAIELPAQESA